MAHLNGIEMGAVRKRAPEAFAVVGGALLAAFPLIRPWGDKAGGPADMVDAFASPMWVAAHGVVLFAGAAWWAWSLVRTPRPALAPPQNSMVGEAMLLTRQ